MFLSSLYKVGFFFKSECLANIWTHRGSFALEWEMVNKVQVCTQKTKLTAEIKKNSKLSPIKICSPSSPALKSLYLFLLFFPLLSVSQWLSQWLPVSNTPIIFVLPWNASQKVPLCRVQGLLDAPLGVDINGNHPPLSAAASTECFATHLIFNLFSIY